MFSCKRKTPKAVTPLKSEISYNKLKLFDESKICVAIPGRKKRTTVFHDSPLKA